MQHQADHVQTPHESGKEATQEGEAVKQGGGSPAPTSKPPPTQAGKGKPLMLKPASIVKVSMKKPMSSAKKPAAEKPGSTTGKAASAYLAAMEEYRSKSCDTSAAASDRPLVK